LLLTLCDLLLEETGYKTVITTYVYKGLARTMYTQLIYGIFGREITKHTAMYGVYIRFWPTLRVRNNTWCMHAYVLTHIVCIGLARTVYVFRV